MDREERLAHTLWWIVMLMALAFFCFAAAVFMLEDREPAVVTVVYEPAEIGEPKLEMPKPATESAPAGLDPMVEGTYLRNDIPLSYDLQAMLYGACLEMGVEYELALAMLEQETQFKNIKGDGGNAYGYFQVWPKWHGDRMTALGVTDLMEPEGNFRVAMHFVRECIDRYGLARGLGFYNGGEAVETKYSREVLEKMEKYYG